MKQVYINHLLDEPEYTHEYNIVDEDDTSYLFRSTASNWNEEAEGRLAVSLEDDGNGIIIHYAGQKKIKLDYAQAEELFILLLHTQDTDLEFKETKTTMKWRSSQ